MSTQTVKTRSKMRASTKIFIGFVVAVVGLYFGYEWYARTAIDGASFQPIKPGRITVLGIRAGGPYQIVVQNRVAVLQMIEGDAGDFEAPDRDERTGEQDLTGKRRIPIRDLLKTLQGDENALAELILVMNDLKDDAPLSRVEWKAEDVRKAIDGDKELAAKLEKNIGVTLDGRPLDEFTTEALFGGIVIKYPVTVEVPVAGVPTQMTAIIDTPYRSQFAAEVEKAMQGDDARFRTTENISGVIQGVAQSKFQSKQFENVRAALRSLVNPDRAKNLAFPVKTIVANANVVLNDSMIEDGSFTTREGAEGEKYFTLTMDLSDEGRRRLWKYSRENRGNQLLVVRDGIAIAAPLIRDEIRGSSVDVTQIQEEGLVNDTVNLIKQLNGKGD